MKVQELKSAADVAHAVPDEKSAVELLGEGGYLKMERMCKKCGKPMTLRKRKETFEFRCRLSKSKDCSTEGVRLDSWFKSTHILLKDCIMVITLWIQNYSSRQIVAETGLSPTTIVDFRNFLRNACSEVSGSYPKIGGPGVTVQIDETAVHARKYGRGQKERELTWVLGAIENGTRKCKMKIIPNRTKITMIPLIRSWIDQQSEIHTDSHKSYGTLDRYFWKHEKVNHSEEFKKVASDGTIVHTNHIEGLWKRLKQPLKSGNGTSEALLASCCDEIVVREWEGAKFGARIWKYIAEFEP